MSHMKWLDYDIIFERKRIIMTEENKRENEEEKANITEEENVEEQYEFGLNEDKREEAEEDGHKLPEEQNTVSTDAKNVDEDN